MSVTAVRLARIVLVRVCSVSGDERPTAIGNDLPKLYAGMLLPSGARSSRCANASNGPHIGLGRSRASAAIGSVRSTDWPACVNDDASTSSPVIVVRPTSAWPRSVDIDSQVDRLPVRRVVHLYTAGDEIDRNTGAAGAGNCPTVGRPLHGDRLAADSDRSQVDRKIRRCGRRCGGSRWTLQFTARAQCWSD